MSGAIKMYRIEVDGHFHGSPDVPRPWVARIHGPDEKFGLHREFVRPMNDWKDARAAWSGNTYGVVATFPLRDGHLYEVSRLRGKPSKRHSVREFYSLEGGRMVAIEPLDALARAEAHDDPVSLFRIRDNEQDRPRVAEVTGVGMPRIMGFIVLNGERNYRLRRDRLYEVHENGQTRLTTADGNVLTQSEALSWLAKRSA